MGRTKVDKILESDLKLPSTQDLIREFIKRTNIEKCGEEDYVLKELVAGKKPSQIIKKLRKKHPDKYFDHKDFNAFMDRNKDIRRQLERENNTLAKRFKAAKADIEETLSDLLLFNKELIRDLYQKGDDTNLNSAIRNLNTTLMNYAKLAGYLEEKDVKNVNIVNMMSDKYEGQRLKDKIHSANFEEEDEIVVEAIKDEDKERKKKR